MINYLKNLFKKPETTPVEQTKNKYSPKYNRGISLVVTYNQPDKQGYQYKQWQTIETDDTNAYAEQREKILKEYEQLIKTIHTQLDDKSSEYIVFNDSFLLKKIDFVNVKVTIEDNQ